MRLSEKISSLLNAINEKTGQSFADLTSAIAYLLENGTPVNPEVDAIVSYFVQQVEDAKAYVNGLSSDWNHYILITDTHYGGNTRRSHPIVKNLWNTGKYNKILHLGDVVTNHTVGEEDVSLAQLNLFADDFGSLKNNFIVVCGNHDETLNPSTVHDYCMNVNSIHYLGGSKTYYWDDTKAKIRFYMIHKYGSNGYIGLIADDIRTNLPQNYSYITCTHIPFGNGIYGGTWDNKSMIKGVAIQKNDMYLGHFTGHEHGDYLDHIVEDRTDFHQITFMSDWLNSANQVGFNDLPVKTEGTITEQAITIVSVNTWTKDVKFYRIGACKDEYKIWGYNYNPTTEFEPTHVPISLYAFRVSASGSSEYYEFQPSYAVSDFMPVDKTKTVKFNMLESMSTLISRDFVMCYDSNKNFLGKMLATTFNETKEIQSMLRDGTAFIKISTLVENFDKFEILVNDVVPETPEKEVTVSFSNGTIAMIDFKSTPQISIS